MDSAIKNLELTITKIEKEIDDCINDDTFYYLKRARREAIICLNTLQYINQ